MRRNALSIAVMTVVAAANRPRIDQSGT